MAITVKWGRERFVIVLPPPDTKLGALRRTLAEHTHLPGQSFKLVHSGAVMKDDNASISAYNIRDNSTIAMIGGTTSDHDQLPPLSHSQNNKTSSAPKTQLNTISQIRSELDTVRNTLMSDVDIFLNTLSSSSYHNSFHPSTDRSPSPFPAQQTSAAGQTSTRSLEKEHTRLAELLLQALLRLDAIATDGTWEDARRERKSAVKEVQGLLDRLDSGWRGRTGT
jgi:hypothetical protein